jgi:hypothetical protein
MRMEIANNLVSKANVLKKYIWRLDMGTTVIDIDKLLESTLDLTSAKGSNKIKSIEIDQLLESTRDW